MKYLVILCLTVITATAGQAADVMPRTYEKPYSMMQKLAPMSGKWSMVVEMTNDGGVTWQATPAQIVDIAFRHKGMILAEIPADIHQSGFHMETYISYDQYRHVFRKAAIDDVWGVMDMYEGTLEGSTLVLTNLKADTSFPVMEGVWRHFRLSVEVASPRRVMQIDKSDDGDNSWQPAFRATYTKLD